MARIRHCVHKNWNSKLWKPTWGKVPVTVNQSMTNIQPPRTKQFPLNLCPETEAFAALSHREGGQKRKPHFPPLNITVLSETVSRFPSCSDILATPESTGGMKGQWIQTMAVNTGCCLTASLQFQFRPGIFESELTFISGAHTSAMQQNSFPTLHIWSLAESEMFWFPSKEMLIWKIRPHEHKEIQAITCKSSELCFFESMSEGINSLKDCFERMLAWNHEILNRSPPRSLAYSWAPQLFLCDQCFSGIPVVLHKARTVSCQRLKITWKSFPD